MRLSARIILVVAQLNGMFPTAAANAAEECGDLGVMQTDNLPEGVDPNNVRTCVNQAPGNDTSTDLTLDHNDLDKRACTSGEFDLGCSGGYCWRICDLGNPPPQPVRQPHTWCWTAENSGYGSWIRCSSSRDCTMQMACGQSTGGAPCYECGCSC